MAYSATVVEVADQTVGGVRYQTYAIDESDVGIADLAEIPLGHQLFTVTLFEAHLRVAGSASTISPELFIATGTPSALRDTLDEVSTTATAEAYQRVGDNVRVVSSSGTLYLYSNPDVATGATGRVDTRITIAVGHL